MKILVVHDVAGCYLPILKIMRSRGHEIEIYKKPETVLKFMEYYNEPGETRYDIGDDEFRQTVIDKAKDVDIVHVGTCSMIVTDLRMIYPKKKIVFNCYGSEVRVFPEYAQIGAKYADITLVTTTDLIPLFGNFKAYQLPHAVDTTLFHKRDLKSRAKICMYNPNIPGLDNAAHDHLKDKLGDISDINLVALYAKPFYEVPNILENFGVYYDVKFDPYTKKLIYDKDGDTMSRMAEEALSMGLIVYDAGMREHRGLPEKYKPENVATLLEEYYRSIFK